MDCEFLKSKLPDWCFGWKPTTLSILQKFWHFYDNNKQTTTSLKYKLKRIVWQPNACPKAIKINFPMQTCKQLQWQQRQLDRETLGGRKESWKIKRHMRRRIQSAARRKVRQRHDRRQETGDKRPEPKECQQQQQLLKDEVGKGTLAKGMQCKQI